MGDTSISTIRQWVAERRLTSYKVGKCLLFRLEDIDDFMTRYVRKSIQRIQQETQGLL